MLFLFRNSAVLPASNQIGTLTQMFVEQRNGQRYKHMDIGPGELMMVLVVVALLFGPGRIAKLGGELGTAIHEFRRGLKTAYETDEQKGAQE